MTDTFASEPRRTRRLWHAGTAGMLALGAVVAAALVWLALAYPGAAAAWLALVTLSAAGMAVVIHRSPKSREGAAGQPKRQEVVAGVWGY